MPLVSVISDNESMRGAVATVISSAGFEIKVFPSAETFIRSDQMSNSACLVVDVQLPGMSGLQLQSHLVAASRHLPIIFVNASADERARTLAFELGAVNFQIQPSGEQALLKEVCLVLKRTTSKGQVSPVPTARSGNF